MSIEKFKECVDNDDVLGAAIACRSLEDLDVVYKEIHNVTPLIYAAYCGVSSIVEMLIDAGAKIEMGTRDGTALHHATQRNQLECARVLRTRGAKINIVDGYGWTALKYACQKRSTDMVKLLLEAYPEPVDTSHMSLALRLASINGSLDIVKLLLEAGALVSVKSVDDENALDVARRAGHADVIEVLTLYQSIQDASH